MMNQDIGLVELIELIELSNDKLLSKSSSWAQGRKTPSRRKTLYFQLLIPPKRFDIFSP